MNLSAISLDLRKLGYKAIQDIYIKTENKGTLPDVAAELLRIPNATFCVKYVGGAYDLRVAIVLADFEDVFRIKRQIGEIKNIKTAEFYVGEIPGPWPDDFIASTLI